MDKRGHGSGCTQTQARARVNYADDAIGLDGRVFGALSRAMFPPDTRWADRWAARLASTSPTSHGLGPARHRSSSGGPPRTPGGLDPAGHGVRVQSPPRPRRAVAARSFLARVPGDGGPPSGARGGAESTVTTPPSAKPAPERSPSLTPPTRSAGSRSPPVVALTGAIAWCHPPDRLRSRRKLISAAAASSV